MKYRILLILLPIIGLACSRQDPKSSPQMKKPIAPVVPRFDGQSAFRYLIKQTDFGPRHPNSQGHQRCGAFLHNELKSATAQITEQNFSHHGYDGENLNLTNYFASFRPEDRNRILLLAHWDTRPRADMEKDPSRQNTPILGANDGASGVAVLLELAMIMKNSPPPIGVDLLFVDGEDYGKAQDLDSYSLGARYFAQTRDKRYIPRFGILLDMVGDKDLQLPIEQNSDRYAHSTVQLVWSTAAELGITQFLQFPGEQVFDDHIPLNEGGIPTIDIIDFSYPHWHTLQDTPDKCSAESLEAVGTVLTHLIYQKLGPSL